MTLVKQDLLQWTLIVLAVVSMAGAVTAGPPRAEPIFEIIAVPEATLNPVAVEDVDHDDEQEWLRQLLVGQATAAGRRAVIDRRVARAIEAHPDGYRLQIEVAVPVTLPPDLSGTKAAFQKGALAVARLQLLDDQGVALAKAETTVRWGQVRWTRGCAIPADSAPRADSRSSRRKR